MRLTFLRHGKAVDRALWHERDADRPLTAEGQDQLRELSRLLRPVVRAGLICTSPWRRARETAEIFAAAWELPLRECAWLAGEAAPAAQWAEELNPTLDTMLVGHEPDLGIAAAWLCGFGPSAGISSLPLKKAGVAILDGLPRPGGMQLMALLPPKTVAAIAKA